LAAEADEQRVDHRHVVRCAISGEVHAGDLEAHSPVHRAPHLLRDFGAVGFGEVIGVHGFLNSINED
jgi:hypothetical protein